MELCRESLFDWFKEKKFADSLNVQNDPSNLQRIEIYSFEKDNSQRLKARKYSHKLWWNLQIADFGLSTFHIKKQSTQFRVLIHMALEHVYIQHLNSGLETICNMKRIRHNKYGFKADIYSLGCIMLQFFLKFETCQELNEALLALKDGRKLIFLNIYIIRAENDF